MKYLRGTLLQNFKTEQMRSINKVILIGNVGGDQDIRTTENGVKVGSFGLATSESYRDKTSGEKREVTDWHNIVVWRGLAEICEKYVKKGSKIYVEGILRTRNWEDANGQKHYKTEVIAETVLLLGQKNTADAAHIADANEESTEGDDDLPF